MKMTANQTAESAEGAEASHWLLSTFCAIRRWIMPPIQSVPHVWIISAHSAV